MAIEDGIIYCIKKASDYNYFIKGKYYIIRQCPLYNDISIVEICNIDGTHITRFSRNLPYNIIFISSYFITLKDCRKQKLENILKNDNI